VRKCFKYPCCTVCNMENGSKKNHVVIDIHWKISIIHHCF
jgi:hypothetical protein